MSGRKKSKAKIHMSKPELPPFLQRMKEQIVANEDAERKEQSERKRKARPGRSDDLDDDPTIVKLDDDDLTEEEYKRMKTELETQYKLSDSERNKSKPVELDIDDLIQNRQVSKDLKTSETQSKTKSEASKNIAKSSSKSTEATSKANEIRRDKKLSYGSSSEDEE